MWVCRRAIGKTWGINPKIALWMCKAILLPKLLHAAIGWWPLVNRVEIRNLLRSLQGNYLRAVVGAMKTTPTEALEVALYQAPLDLFAIETAGLTAYRLKCQGEWRNAGSGHTKLAFRQKYPYTLNQDRILKKYQQVKSYKIRIPTRQDWQEPETIIDHKVDHWYTDGSGIQNCFGAGIYGPSYDYRESIPMGSLSMVFSAEVMAVLRCAELLLTKNLTRRRIHICCDSRAAIAALAKTTTESSLVWECMQVLEKLSKSNRVILMWIPGHQGIPRNEEADRLAKEGSAEVSPDQFAAVPFSVGKNLIRKQLEQRHRDRWAACPGYRQSKVLMSYLLPSRASELLAMNKSRLRTAVGLLTGHTSLRAHFYKLGHRTGRMPTVWI
jgi:ribonuclease HI